jgi:hypothetical protein
VPELGEVLSGVLAEVVRGRLAADFLTAQLVETYRKDPALSMLSVPRVTINEMSVKLRFAVTALETPPVMATTTAGGATEAWRDVLQERVLNRVATSRLEEVPPEMRAEIETRLAEEPPVVDYERVRSALTGEPKGLVEDSVAGVVARFQAVPTRLRRRLGTLTDIRAEVEREVQTELASFIDQAREIEDARLAYRSRLQIEVASDDLQARPTEVIQEVTLTLSMADVETALSEIPLTRLTGG